ncbi:MAG: HPr family phosphocarrier protein, partial [Propionibacteriaceae bacterium]
MPSKTVIVGSAVGLHARPAAIIAEVAEKYDEVLLSTDAENEVEA